MKTLRMMRRRPAHASTRVEPLSMPTRLSSQCGVRNSRGGRTIPWAVEMTCLAADGDTRSVRVEAGTVFKDALPIFGDYLAWQNDSVPNWTTPFPSCLCFYSLHVLLPTLSSFVSFSFPFSSLHLSTDGNFAFSFYIYLTILSLVSLLFSNVIHKLTTVVTNDGQDKDCI